MSLEATTDRKALGSRQGQAFFDLDAKIDWVHIE
jgi:hypothetical protein